MHQAPELAVDSRVRPTHYKPHVEREMEEIASMPAFKAQPVNPAVMNSHGQLGVTHVPPKPTTTGHAPVLATEKRAAAHPKPAEEQPQPPLKPAPAFDPLRLTKAHSPKLATTMRTRSKSMAPAPDGPAFVFKAQPALGPSGPAKVSKPSRSRRHTTTSFQPFHLSTEERGGAKQSALEKAAAAKRAAEAAVPAFRAAPVPPTLRQRARLPPVPEKAPTAPEPFHLISEARHREAVLQQEMQNEARSAKRHREATFKAAPAPAHPRPRPPRPSRQPLTAAQTPDLALRSRSVARAAFDAAVAEKERRAEEAKKLEEERAAEEEAKEIKRLRKTLVFKARPAPGHGIALYDPRVPIVQQSPFQNTRSRSRLPR
ncbi:g3864 [Coccomyxa elongata]